MSMPACFIPRPCCSNQLLLNARAAIGVSAQVRKKDIVYRFHGRGCGSPCRCPALQGCSSKRLCLTPIRERGVRGQARFTPSHDELGAAGFNRVTPLQQPLGAQDRATERDYTTALRQDISGPCLITELFVGSDSPVSGGELGKNAFHSSCAPFTPSICPHPGSPQNRNRLQAETHPCTLPYIINQPHREDIDGLNI
ncbi:hypothetical protein AOLI_G00122540 [Acnodon oligacanthus]